MSRSEEKGKRPRLRAPISCLNCKRRKVRCDKGRPCSGCVKNNVGHLCVYVDPKWVDSSKVVATAASRNVVAENSAEMNLLRVELQRKIDKQEGEIQCLRAQLAHQAKSVSVKDQSRKFDVKLEYSEPTFGTGTNTLKSSKTDPKHSSAFGVHMREIFGEKKIPITVFEKLSTRTQNEPPHVILHDKFYTMSGFRAPVKATECANNCLIPHPITGLYSWLNFIKIDPQLTNFWFKITNLQKAYHIYKKSLIRSGSPAPAMSYSQQMQLSDSSGCGHNKCPVVACEFNLMLEDTETADSDGTNSIVKASSEVTVPAKREMSNDNSTKNAFGIQASLQSLWNEILNLARNTKMLTYSQIRFLVSLYMDPPFNDINNGVESRHLLRFFQNDILSVFSANGTEAKLEYESLSSKSSDSKVLNLLKVKAIYLSMLALIVEEAIESLHSAKADMKGLILAEIWTKFPIEFTHPGITAKPSQCLPLVLKLVEYLFDPKRPLEDLDTSMLALSLLVTLLNRITLLYEREHLSIDVRDSFTKVFVLIFDLFEKQGQYLSLWFDPALVKFQTFENQPEITKNIRVLLCRLWNDVLRLVNNATFHILPLLRHSSNIDRILDDFLTKASEAGVSHTHIAYLSQIPATQPQDTAIKDLEASLWAQNVLLRATVLVRNAIHSTCTENRVSVSEIADVVAEMAQWDTISENKISETICKFEIKVVFEYLQFYFASIVFLQFEETVNRDIIAKLAPLLWNQFMEINRYLQSSTLAFAKHRYCRYAWAVIAEVFARMSHLISGLLIRFKPDPEASPTSALKMHASEYLVYAFQNSTTAGIHMPVSMKEKLIGEADRTVEILENHMGSSSSRTRTKIWKFYQTFIRNSHRANPVSYARLHAEAVGAGRLLDRCPIMTSSSGYETSDTRNEVASWPVLKPKTDTRMSTTSICPVSAISGVSPALPGPKGIKFESVLANMGITPLGQCPFGNSAEIGAADTTRKRDWGHVQDTDDHSPSFVGRIMKYTPPLCAPIQSPLPSAVIPLSDLRPPPNQDSPLIQAPFGDMDWDSLPNFNFEMMDDEELFSQLNGGDLNNTMIEGLFQ